MKKQISKVLIFVLIVQAIASMFFNVSYAADDSNKNCDVCTATSPHMTIYLQFQKEAATVLSTNRFKTVQRQVSEGEGGLFTSEILKIKEDEDFNNTLAGKALRVLDITATRTTTSLLTSVFLFELAAIGALADNTIGLTILFQDRPIVRDWTKLLDVEWGLSQTAYDLGVVGEIGKTISSGDALDKIVKKYVGEGLFQSGAGISSDSYANIIMQLAELNSAVKWFLVYDSKSLFDDYNLNYPNVKVDEAWVNDLASEYKCSRRKFGFKCNTSWASLKKNLQILTNNTNKQGKSSIKQIKDSYEDLKDALGNWTAIKNRIQGKDLKLSPREREILRNRYGLNAEKLTKGQGSSIISLNSNLSSQWNKLSKGVTTAVENVKAAINDYKKAYAEAKEKLKNEKESKKVIKEMKKEMEKEAYVGERLKMFFAKSSETGRESTNKNTKVLTSIESALNKVNESKTNVTAVITIANPIDLSNDYSVMLAAIEKLINSIGDKDSGLRMWLNSICTAQCSNKGNDCCYVK